MIRACVLGSPVAHSLSPLLHGYWLRRHGVAGAYSLREVLPENLATVLDELARAGYAGCNLTLPLKERAVALMDVCDESVHAAGAVNTVVFRDGKKVGYNSDGFGFVEGLTAAHPDWRRDHAVIAGAGGAARGVAAALKKAGVARFSIINRTAARAEKMIRDLALSAEVRAAVPQDATLLVNCTSLGMAGQPPLALDISGLPPEAIVCDIVYRPLQTGLLKQAALHGLRSVGGLPMLLHQGRLGFRHWFGIDPAVTGELYEEMARCAEK